MIDILVGLIVILVITALCYWVAGLVGAPHPIPQIILVFGVVIAVLYFIVNLGDIGEGEEAALLIPALLGKELTWSSD